MTTNHLGMIHFLDIDCSCLFLLYEKRKIDAGRNQLFNSTILVSTAFVKDGFMDHDFQLVPTNAMLMKKERREINSLHFLQKLIC
uniref:Uncharacterized protein n=1 Tax=Onchocerca volvulus TaxID=6282 RepID=A0A8R1XPZ4_ONCVO